MIASLRESKTRLSELVNLANSGEEILITVHGQPISPHSLCIGAQIRYRRLVARVKHSPFEFRPTLYISKPKCA